MSFWKKVTSSLSDLEDSAKKQVNKVSSSLADLEDSGGGLSAAALFANPLIAQDIMGSAFAGALSRGADARTAFTSAGQSSGSALAGGSPDQWKDLAAFNAALVAGAAGGALGGAAFGAGGISGIPATAALSSSGVTGLAAGTAGALAAGGVYAGTQALRGVTGVGGEQGELPPDMAAMYANDPSTAAQFQRLRRASRSLGRAGTFKNKGAGTSLGLGDSVLGDQLSLIGS